MHDDIILLTNANIREINMTSCDFSYLRNNTVDNSEIRVYLVLHHGEHRIAQNIEYVERKTNKRLSASLCITCMTLILQQLNITYYG